MSKASASEVQLNRRLFSFTWRPSTFRWVDLRWKGSTSSIVEPKQEVCSGRFPRVEGRTRLIETEPAVSCGNPFPRRYVFPLPTAATSSVKAVQTVTLKTFSHQPPLRCRAQMYLFNFPPEGLLGIRTRFPVCLTGVWRRQEGG